MSVPSEYDLTQDALIAPMRDILLTAAEPPSGPEFSYPVVDQAVSASMWQWITLGMGSGILDAGGRPYWLTSLDNASNTATLTVSTTVGTANAVLRGFFHQLSDSMTVSLPMPSSGNITYHVCLTYDPREESSQDGPISVQVYSSAPPDTFGRHHIVLWTVRRSANQLLTDATVTQVRPKVAPTITVDTPAQLPPPSSTLWGTTAVVTYGAHCGALFQSAADDTAPTPTRWDNLTSPEWQPLTLSAYVRAGSPRPEWRLRQGELQLRGRVNPTGSTFSAEAQTIVGYLPGLDLGSWVRVVGGNGARVAKLNPVGGSGGWDTLALWAGPSMSYVYIDATIPLDGGE